MGEEPDGAGVQAQVDHYTLLGVSRKADRDEIRRRFRALMRVHHPDKLVAPPVPGGPEPRRRHSGAIPSWASASAPSSSSSPRSSSPPPTNPAPSHPCSPHRAPEPAFLTRDSSFAARLNLAYETLSDEALRASYDAGLDARLLGRRGDDDDDACAAGKGRRSGPRISATVELDELLVEEDDDDDDDDGAGSGASARRRDEGGGGMSGSGSDSGDVRLWLPCRCGQRYVLSRAHVDALMDGLEQGHHEGGIEVGQGEDDHLTTIPLEPPKGRDGGGGSGGGAAAATAPWAKDEGVANAAGAATCKATASGSDLGTGSPEPPPPQDETSSATTSSGGAPAAVGQHKGGTGEEKPSVSQDDDKGDEEHKDGESSPAAATGANTWERSVLVECQGCSLVIRVVIPAEA